MKAFLDAIQSVAMIGAIIAGGIWTYMLFIEQRQQYPHLKIEHNVEHLPLPDHRILLFVDISQSDIGTVKLSFTSAEIKIYSLEPRTLGDDAVNKLNEGTQLETEESPDLWEIVAERKTKWQRDELVVEPGESNQLHYEFILSDDVGPLLIYSYFKNPAITKRDIGWMTRSLYDPRERKKSTAGSREPKPLFRRAP
jgi:hypothetical protein